MTDEAIFEQEAISDLPDNWAYVELGKVLKRVSNGTTSKQNKEGIGLPVTRIETISDGTVNLERTSGSVGMNVAIY